MHSIVLAIHPSAPDGAMMLKVPRDFVALQESESPLLSTSLSLVVPELSLIMAQSNSMTLPIKPKLTAPHTELQCSSSSASSVVLDNSRGLEYYLIYSSTMSPLPSSVSQW